MGRVQISAMLLIALTCACSNAGAAQEGLSHGVSIEVPHILSLSSDKSSFTLTFEDNVFGAETNVETVNYSILGNSISSNEGVLQARSSSASQGIDLQANVGSFVANGGNGVLVESFKDFKTIGTTNMNLADRQTVNGSGKIIKGSLPVNYKAVAEEDLTPGIYVREITLTLTDN